MTYQIKAYGTLVHMGNVFVMLEIYEKILKKKRKFCIYIILQKAMRPIGRSPASTNKSMCDQRLMSPT